jgi:hypothetical protein
VHLLAPPVLDAHVHLGLFASGQPLAIQLVFGQISDLELVFIERTLEARDSRLEATSAFFFDNSGLVAPPSPFRRVGRGSTVPCHERLDLGWI